jgi:hypothetical protein
MCGDISEALEAKLGKIRPDIVQSRSLNCGATLQALYQVVK